MFTLLMLFLCVIMHTMWSDRACNYYASYPLVYMFVCHQDDICENSIDSVYVGGYCGLSENGLCLR